MVSNLVYRMHIKDDIYYFYHTAYLLNNTVIFNKCYNIGAMVARAKYEYGGTNWFLQKKIPEDVINEKVDGNIHHCF